MPLRVALTLRRAALQHKTRFRGSERVGWMFTFAGAAYNLLRMCNLQAAIARGELCSKGKERPRRTQQKPSD
jgi:hypothetical protein